MAAAGSDFGEAITLMHASGASMHLGLYEEAEASCRRSMGLATSHREVSIEGQLKLILSTVLGRSGRTPAALDVLASARLSADRRVAHYARAVAAEIYLREGSVDLALVEARSAVESPYPHTRSHGRCILARCCLVIGCFRQALEEAELALSAGIIVPPDEVDVLTARAEASRALGDLNGAHASIEQARGLLLKIVEGIESPDLRNSFLTKVETNARVFSLAAAWLGTTTD